MKMNKALKSLLKRHTPSYPTFNDVRDVCEVIGLKEFSYCTSIYTPNEIGLKIREIHFYSFKKRGQVKLLIYYLKYQMPFIHWNVETFPYKIKLNKREH